MTVTLSASGVTDYEGVMEYREPWATEEPSLRWVLAESEIFSPIPRRDTLSHSLINDVLARQVDRLSTSTTVIVLDENA